MPFGAKPLPLIGATGPGVPPAVIRGTPSKLYDIRASLAELTRAVSGELERNRHG